MTLRISKVFTYDEDAGNYIQAVEAADGQALEGATRQAINNFVIGCKQDGIWTAIKASCILAGARTLAGALVPLVGAAPTNFNFVAGDYNRKTGLKGGSPRYLNANISPNFMPQNSIHLSVYKGAQEASNLTLVGNINSPYVIIDFPFNGKFRSLLNNNTGSVDSVTNNVVAGFFGASRFSSAQVKHRSEGVESTYSQSSSAPNSTSIGVFARLAPAPQEYGNHRLAFYSIGEALDLALLDARVTALINALGAAIP